jgi:hypothetical protein
MYSLFLLVRVFDRAKPPGSSGYLLFRPSTPLDQQDSNSQPSSRPRGCISVPVDRAGWRELSGQPQAMTTRLRKPVNVGSPYARRLITSPVDDRVGVAVGGRLVEVAEQLGAPRTDAHGERIECWKPDVVDGDQKRIESCSASWRPARCSRPERDESLHTIRVSGSATQIAWP